MDPTSSSRPQALPCQEVVELVTDYLEAALRDDEHARFDEHLGSCRHCAVYVEQMRITIRVIGKLRDQRAVR